MLTSKFQVGILEGQYLVGTFLNGLVTVDATKVTRNTMIVNQGSLGFGPRQFATDPKFTDKLEAYE